MADVIDVLNALTTLCTSTLYPNGTSNPVSPVNSATTRIYPGWPDSTQLDTDLDNGVVTVSVFTGKVARNTTRFIDGWQPYGTVTAGVSGNAPTQQAAREVRRVQREIQITVWAPTPALRATTGTALDLALASADRLTLSDSSVAQMRYSRDTLDDVPQKALLYRYDLFYWVEYGTFQTATDYIVEEIIANVTPANSPTNTVTVI